MSEKVISPEECISQGRRELVCGEIVKAVASFQSACEQIAKENGDLHESLAEPNLLYGTALLELARMENNVLGNALEGVPEDEKSVDEENFIEKQELTEDDKEEIADKVIDAMCTDQNESSEPKPESEVENKDEKVADEKEESESKETEEKATDPQEEPKGDESKEPEENNEAKTKDEEATEEKAKTTDEEATEEKAETEDNEEEEDGDGEEGDENGEEDGKDDNESEDVSNLQLAWECIEVAKTIFSKSDTKENKLKVSDCFEKLAEISREKEDYEQAIMDINEALKVRQELLGDADRIVAETYYQIGTTFAVAGKLDDAKNAFELCVTCLKKTIEELESVNKKYKEEAEAKAEEISKNDKTIEEIKELIPDIEKRISEIEEDKAEELKMIAIKAQEAAKFDSDSSAPTSDITHLVKKKKRPADEEVEDSSLDKENVDGSKTENAVEKSPVAKKMKVVDEEKISDATDVAPTEVEA